MTREELEHAIRAACDVARDTEVYVFGSQSVLGQFPEAPQSLRQSAEADVMPKNNPELVDHIDGALGELSTFHSTHGFYVHGVPIEIAILPEGWERRAIPVKNENTRGCTGWCLEVHDLAASKLAAFRHRDLDFVRTLLIEKMIDLQQVTKRIASLPVDDTERKRLVTWLKKTAAEI